MEAGSRCSLGYWRLKELRDSDGVGPAGLLSEPVKSPGGQTASGVARDDREREMAMVLDPSEFCRNEEEGLENFQKLRRR